MRYKLNVTERSVTAMLTICLSSREVVHGGGCDRPRWSVVPSCIQRSRICIAVVRFRPTRLPISLKDNPQSLVHLRHGDTLNSRRATSPLVRLVDRKEREEAPDHPKNFGGTEPKRTVI
ncbi:uncharacterized protein TNCV_4860011 [Trichonephila clavipes]|nr:uncharacterized protein TNCV_4860011 [Trichonephila clavipes]